MNHTIITCFWPLTNANQILGLKFEEYSSLEYKLVPNQTLTDSVVSCVTDLKLCKNNTMGKSNFWRNILISSDFMRYLALQSIMQFPKLNIYLHTLQKVEEKLCESSFRNYFTPCSISVENAIFYWCFSRTLWAEGWGMEKESGWSLMAHLAYIYSPLTCTVLRFSTSKVTLSIY